MNFAPNLKIGQRLGIGFAVVLSLLLVITVLAIWRLQEVAQASQQHLNAVIGVLKASGASVEKTSSGVHQMTTSIHEHPSVSQEIAHNVEHIARMAEDNHAAIQSSAESARLMQQLPEQLHGTVALFSV